MQTAFKVIDLPGSAWVPVWWSLGIHVLMLVLGVVLIVRSQSIANTFFKA